MEKQNKIKRILQHDQFTIVISLIILCIVGGCLTNVFLTGTNIMNVLRSASLTAVTAMGMSFILLIGEIDLSVGSTQGFVGVIVVMLANMTQNFFVALVLALLVGAAIGFANSLLVTKCKINSLIATLGTMAILRGVAYVSTDGVSLQVNLENYSEFGAGYWGPFPIPLVIAVVIFVILFFVLNKTAFGRYIYSVGGNESASVLSGIDVNKIKILVYMLSGVLTALSAVMLSSRLNSGQPNAGIGFEFEVIAAVVLGGVSMDGGKGSLLGAIVGVLILSVLKNILVLMNVSSFYQEVARGIVILIAVYLDGRSKRAMQKKLLLEKIA